MPITAGERKMNRIKNAATFSLIVFSMLLGMSGTAEAQRRNDRDIRDAVRILNSKLEDFEYNLRFQMQSGSADRTSLSIVGDDIRALRDSINRFQDNYDSKRENRDDVSAIVDAASRVESFMQANPQNRRVQDEWTGVRSQIDRLSSNYGITNRWATGSTSADRMDDDPPAATNTISIGLSGTYDLDLSRSESIDDIVSDTRLGNDQRAELKDKLASPGQIAIDVRGNQVTLATSNAAPVLFTADGREKTERSASGKTVRLKAILRGQELVVSSLGGDRDYTITFTSISNGKGLKVSRRITTEYLSQTVFAESVYNKTDSVARLGIRGGQSTASNDDSGYSDNTGSTAGSPRPGIARSRAGDFIVPDGTIISGRLENEITTKASQNNDRFRLTVQSPLEFRGAVIEGYISGVGRSGKVTGRSNVTFNFEKITLRDGKTYDFAGSLQSVKDAYGKTVSIDNEGTARGDDQTRETAKRGGIGAGLGAVIGAIAGGAKGAAIGAVIGAGGGAGSVAVQGREDLELQVGSTISIVASSPIQRDIRDR